MVTKWRFKIFKADDIKELERQLNEFSDKLPENCKLNEKSMRLADSGNVCILNYQETDWDTFNEVKRVRNSFV